MIRPAHLLRSSEAPKTATLSGARIRAIESRGGAASAMMKSSDEGGMAEQLAADDEPVDARGAVDHRQHAAVAPAALDAALLGGSHGAHDVHRGVADAHRSLGRVDLSHRGFARVGLALIHQPQRMEAEEARGGK